MTQRRAVEEIIAAREERMTKKTDAFSTQQREAREQIAQQNVLIEQLTAEVAARKDEQTDSWWVRLRGRQHRSITIH
jgi:hypothetical protein